MFTLMRYKFYQPPRSELKPEIYITQLLNVTF